MEWYSGDIGTAISESKTKKLIFLVYVFDSNSEPTNELWNKETVYKPCKENCVSIKLEADSVPCNQFKQIYPISSYPTTYLIGVDGKPLVVLVGNISEEEFFSKIENAIQTHNSQKLAETQVANQAASSSIANETDSTSPTTSSKTENEKSIDERVALAKEKLKQIQEKKKTEEDEKEKNSEIERRKMGQEILKAKREKEEQELRQLAEERKREKQEDEIARQRVRERIQQDREEKQKRYALEKEDAEKAKNAERAKLELQKQQEKLAEAARNSNIARLQFRFVDGSSINNQFDPNQTLEEIRQFVAQKLREMNDNSAFTLHSSFPKKEYTSSDMSLTLRELNLAPSASLLVIPVKSKASKTLSNLIPTSSSSSNRSTSTVATYATDLASLIFLPITIIWGIITNFFGGGSNRQNSNNNTQNNRTWTDPQTNTQTNPNLRRRNLNNNSGSNFGNLGDIRDDDENATWNGNSTQQM